MERGGGWRAHGALLTCPGREPLLVAPAGRSTRRHSGWGRPSTVYVLRRLSRTTGSYPSPAIMTRCWLGSVDSAHETGVAVFSQPYGPDERRSSQGPRHHSWYQDNPGHARDAACRSGFLDSGAARHGGLRCYSCRCSAHCGRKALIAPPAGRWPEVPGHEPRPRQKSGRNRASLRPAHGAECRHSGRIARARRAAAAATCGHFRRTGHHRLHRRRADADTTPAPAAPLARAPVAVQDRLASWVCDLSLLHELTERLARTGRPRRRAARGAAGRGDPGRRPPRPDRAGTGRRPRPRHHRRTRSRPRRPRHHRDRPAPAAHAPAARAHPTPAKAPRRRDRDP